MRTTWIAPAKAAAVVFFVLYCVPIIVLRHLASSPIILLFFGLYFFYCAACSFANHFHLSVVVNKLSAALSAIVIIGTSIFTSLLVFGLYLFKSAQVGFGDEVELGLNDTILGILSLQSVIFVCSSFLTLRGRRPIDQIFTCVISIVVTLAFLPGIAWLRL